MPVRVDASELKRVLQMTPTDQNVMLVGRHGIGKSQIIIEFYSQQGLKLVPFFLGQMSDPGDLIGLLHKDQQTGRSEFLPPFWWPEPDQPIVLFLDELNRARPEILQSVMELALNKSLAGKRLPEGSIIVSAVNEGDEYQLTDLDPALVSRFNVYEFAPSVEDWLQWADRTEIDHRVKQFIESYPHYLDGDPTMVDEAGLEIAEGLAKTPDRRGWARVARAIAEIDPLEGVHVKLVAGIVGSAAANAFRRSLVIELPTTPADVLLGDGQQQEVLDALDLPQLLMLNDRIVPWLRDGELGPQEQDQARRGLLEYIRVLRRRKLDEAVAHLISLMEKPRNEATLDFACQSVELAAVLAEYLESIRIE